MTVKLGDITSAPIAHKPVSSPARRIFLHMPKKDHSIPFRYYEDVVVYDLMMNGSRRDARGRFIRAVELGPKKGMLEVEVNTVSIYMPPERIERWEDYKP